MSRFSLLFVFLFFLASSASAAIVNIEYTGLIYNTTGDGLGYQNGDSITGSYVIDTSKAEGKSVDTSTEVWYYGSVDSGLLQSNFASPTAPGYIDYVRAHNGSAGINDVILLDKVLGAFDPIDFSLKTLGIRFEFDGLDWISDLSLNNINLVSDQHSFSSGGFFRFNTNNWFIIDSASFSIDSVRISSIPDSLAVSVPEPTPLVLLSVAFAGLVIRRRFI